MPNIALIGIDLGTTNSTCRLLIIRDDGELDSFQLPIKQVVFYSKDKQEYKYNEVLPSCVIVSETNDNVYCGKIDTSCQDDEYYPIKNIKTSLSNDLWKENVGGHILTPVGISAIILYTINESIKEFIDANKIESIESIIITIPASFSSKMRRSTLNAAIMAGFDKSKISLLDEPVAAIMSGFEIRNNAFKDFIPDDKPILVFDMGGGTVDVTVIEINNNNRTIEIKASSRYNELGGNDIDLEIASLILHKMQLTDAIKKVIEGIKNDKHQARIFANKLLEISNELKVEIDTIIKNLNLRVQTIDQISHRTDLPELTINTINLLGLDFELQIKLTEIIDVLTPYISVSNKSNGRNIFNPLKEVDDGKDTYNFKVGGSSQFSLIDMELTKELGAFKNDLDATFSISVGAVNFAFLNERMHWKINERTNEKIFLRRNGMPPLEILSNNLPIPSIETDPPKALDGNNTIEWVAGTDTIELEFYQGISVNDIGLSLLHIVTIPLPDTIIEKGKLNKLKGKIDANKVYHFKMEITDGGEIAFEGEITFDKSSYRLGKKTSELSGLNINTEKDAS